MRRADHFRNAGVLGQDVEDVGVFGKIAEYVRMKSRDDLFSSFVRCAGFEDGLVHLALFDDFHAVGGNQIAHISAEWVNARFGLPGINVDKKLVLRRRASNPAMYLGSLWIR